MKRLLMLTVLLLSLALPTGAVRLPCSYSSECFDEGSTNQLCVNAPINVGCEYRGVCWNCYLGSNAYSGKLIKSTRWQKWQSARKAKPEGFGPEFQKAILIIDPDWLKGVGLQRGDLLLTADGPATIESMQKLLEKESGQVTVMQWRNGRFRSLTWECGKK